MDNIFVFAGFIAAVFFIAKFIEMRFVEQESKPLKLLVRDTVLVYISAVVGSYVVEQISPAISESINAVASPAVFNDNPDF
jgi:hypothetical protein